MANWYQNFVEQLILCHWDVTPKPLSLCILVLAASPDPSFDLPTRRGEAYICQAGGSKCWVLSPRASACVSYQPESYLIFARPRLLIYKCYRSRNFSRLFLSPTHPLRACFVSNESLLTRQAVIGSIDRGCCGAPAVTYRKQSRNSLLQKRAGWQFPHDG